MLKPGITRMHLPHNYDACAINVEFLIIHYSATSLNGLLEIFFDEKSEVSAHFVITEAGKIIEMVPCMNELPNRAWHAGYSRWEDEKLWTKFNDISIGVELINRNGNIFPYSWKQMEALKELIFALQQKFPALKNPRRILGHEHIAGYRGKIDPGIYFNWADVFRSCYAGQEGPGLQPMLPARIAAALKRNLLNAGQLNCADDNFWQRLNTSLEQQAAHLMKDRSC
jgi:N-acetylmuramoyl-L-alanine amidase